MQRAMHQRLCLGATRCSASIHLHQALYPMIRAEFRLSAQMVVRCFVKVADAYKLDKNAKRVFKAHGAIAYDERILRYLTDKQPVSIWVLPGRETIPYRMRRTPEGTAQHQKGESDLVYHRGKWYLLATCDDRRSHARTD